MLIAPNDWNQHIAPMWRRWVATHKDGMSILLVSEEMPDGSRGIRTVDSAAADRDGLARLLSRADTFAICGVPSVIATARHLGPTPQESIIDHHFVRARSASVEARP